MNDLSTALALPVNFDANAAGCPLPQALQAYAEASAEFGNPSSSHDLGRRAGTRLTRARASIARWLGVDADEVVFGSGGTEADAQAVLGVAAHRPGTHMICSGIEHPGVAKNMVLAGRRYGIELTVVPAGRDGVVRPADVEVAMRGDTSLVSVTTASNETGVVQPINELAEICHRAGVLFHTDAVQALGRMPLSPRDTGVHLMSLSGHKVGAVSGIGVLFVKNGVRLQPILGGGGQEGGFRASTENVAGAASMAAALEALGTDRDDHRFDQLARARDLFERRLRAAVSDIDIVGSEAHRLPNTSCVRFEGCDGEGMMMALDVRGICVSTGSACSSGAIDPSPVLLGMGFRPEEARQVVRFSLPPQVTEAQIEHVVAETARVAGAVRMQGI